MLHIKKQRTDPEVVTKVAEIKSTSAWKNTSVGETEKIRDFFEQLPKDKIRIHLLQEQHYLCAYCMKRIQDDPLETTIEHWFPLDKDKDKALDYKNMLAVCRGGATLDLEKGHKRELCCDASKGNSEIKINPLNEIHMNKVKYTREGIVQTGDESLDFDINNVLRLNGIRDENGNLICDTSTALLKGRKNAVQKSVAIIEVLDRKRKLTSAMLKRKVEEIKEKPMRDEFAGVTIFFLERKIRLLQKLGK